MKTVELSGAALDYAVCLAEGIIQELNAEVRHFLFWQSRGHNCYTTSVAGDDIIDREGITTTRCEDSYAIDTQGYTTGRRIPVWAATLGKHGAEEIYGPQGDSWGCAYILDANDVVHGATRREAAVRAWCLYKLGKEVDIPKELL